MLVKMRASSINPSDLLFISGTYTKKPAFPAVPGFEGVGVVEESGGGLLGWLRKGKRVAVINEHAGNWSEYSIVSAKHVVPVPDDISDEQAACFFVNPATALVMTRYEFRIPRGEWLLQSAAGSALGKMIIRLAKREGFKTINIVRRLEQIDELKRLGADEVIQAEGASITERVLAFTKGKGVRFAIDAVGGETGSALIASLGDNGRALLYGLLSGKPVEVDPRRLLSGNKSIGGFLLSDWAVRQNVFTLLGLFRRITRLMREGILSTEQVISYELSNFSKAIEQAMTPGKPGKIVLRMSQMGGK